MRGTLMILLVLAVTACSPRPDTEVTNGRASTASSSSSPRTAPAVSPTTSAPGDCEALASYLARGGGSSHDDVYDPVASELLVYGLDGHEYLLTPADDECIRASAAVSGRIRDAVTAAGEELTDSALGQLVAAR